MLISADFQGIPESAVAVCADPANVGAHFQRTSPRDPELESTKKEANSCGSSLSIEVQEILNNLAQVRLQLS